MTMDSGPLRPARASHSGAARGTATVFAIILLANCGCTVVQHETTATKSIFQSLSGKNKGGPTNVVAALQSEVMREADEFVGAVAQATDDFRSKVNTPEARVMGQRWKLLEATGAYINATGENPAINAVDMVVLATLSRMVIEDLWVGEKFGDAALPLLEVHRQLETNAWSVASQVLSPDQQKDVANLLKEYDEKHPHLRHVAAVRFPELAESLGKLPTDQQGQKPGSVFSLLYLNPLAGLDPTTQAIQQTRILAQRMMYYVQRASILWSWQVELLVYQLADQPDTKQILADVARVSLSMEVYAKTAQELPRLVNDQREAAINQIFDRLALERTNLVADLYAEETKLRGLLNETRQTLSAGNDMAISLNAAIKSLDAFVRYVSPAETNAAPQPPDTNSHPFNVLDYGKAATDIGVMAKDLNTLLTTANKTAPEVAKLGESASADMRRVVHRAFWLGLVLILVLLVGSVVAALAYRRLAPRSQTSLREDG